MSPPFPTTPRSHRWSYASALTLRLSPGACRESHGLGRIKALAAQLDAHLGHIDANALRRTSVRPCSSASRTSRDPSHRPVRRLEACPRPAILFVLGSLATDLRPLCAARPALRGCHPLGLAAREHSDSRPVAFKDLLLPISHEDGCWSRGGQVSPCKDCGPASVSLEFEYSVCEATRLRGFQCINLAVGQHHTEQDDASPRTLRSLPAAGLAPDGWKRGDDSWPGGVQAGLWISRWPVC